MKKILYYDCFAGISGDMHLGAMIDVGIETEYLKEELDKLRLDNYTLKVEKDKRHGITGTRVDVGYNHQGEHGHRNLKDIMDILTASSLPEGTKKRAEKMFTLLAEAEARVHNKRIDEIHFHEVGAIDSIIDIVGAAICIEKLDPDVILASSVELGGGFVDCAHGRLPVPAPATVEILQGIPVSSGAVNKETTTPTGAVILAANVHEFTPLKGFSIRKTAYGVGQRKMDIPNLLRVFLGESHDQSPETADAPDGHLMIECNIDDMNPELYGYIMELLFEKGADDVFLTPITMKKVRPASKLSVLCSKAKEEALTGIILRETTTIGLRSYPVNKTMLEREFTQVETKYGTVTLKTALYRGKRLKTKPEYEDCIRMARSRKISLQEVYREINKHIKD